jgi:peptidoglycan-N-acetylglucosamine deacetylase
LRGLKARVTRRLAAGDILLLHEGLPPRAEGGIGLWLAAVEGVLDAMAGKGLRAALLSEVIRRPVLESAAPAAGEAPDSIRLFYDGLSGLYDDEQDAGMASRLRRSEREAVLARIGGLFSPEDSVLEIGAGTGRFTLPLARAAGRITAVDLSEGMLRVLEGKARAAGLTGIRVIRGDAGRLSFEATFDAVCAFSSLEYFRDLSGLLGRLRACLKPGGLLYFTLPRRSFLRIFGQIGNAMRQGVWLRAYGRRGLVRILHRAGFLLIEIRPFGLKSILSSGILWEVVARRDDAVPPSPRD